MPLTDRESKYENHIKDWHNITVDEEVTRAVELAVKRCLSETDGGEEDGADLTEAVQEGGNVVQDVARGPLLIESQDGNGRGSKVIGSRLRMAKELEDKEVNGGGMADSLHPGVAECVQENVAASSGKKS